MTTNADHEIAAAMLEATGNYRVLRRLKPRAVINDPTGVETKLGLFLDLETTGLDPAKDEIIEIGMVPFTFGLDGRIYEVGEAFSRLRQPSIPIPAEITRITGITDEMVAGQVIAPSEITAFAASAVLIIAHNAAFDRKFAERFCDVFRAKAWACSMSQVDWVAEGFDGTKLAYLLVGCGLFHDAHRAKDDCLAAIEVLARPLPQSGILAMNKLLEAARAKTCRIWAEGSPFDMKDILKARGYRWNPGNDGRPKAWSRDVPEETLPLELSFLRAEIYQYQADIPVTHLTALDRFSDRV